MRLLTLLTTPKLLLFAVGVALFGCNKVVVVNQGQADVNFTVDWSSIKEGCQPPSGASIYLYPIAGGEPISTRTTAKKANLVVPEGRYRIVMHNDGLTNLKFKSTNSYNDFEAYLEPQKLPGKADPEMVVPQSDYLHLLMGTDSKEINVIKDVPLNLTLYPATATFTYRFKINVESPNLYIGAWAIMSGIATKINVYTAKVLSQDISNIEVPLAVVDAPEGKQNLGGSVEVLGVDPANRTAGTNNMHIVLQRGGGMPDEVLDCDMTDKLTGFENKNLDIEVIIKPKPNPDPDPDPDDPVLVVVEVIVKPWNVQPPVDLDIMPT